MVILFYVMILWVWNSGRALLRIPLSCVASPEVLVVCSWWISRSVDLGWLEAWDAGLSGDC